MALGRFTPDFMAGLRDIKALLLDLDMPVSVYTNATLETCSRGKHLTLETRC